MHKAREGVALNAFQLFEGQGMVSIFRCLNKWAVRVVVKALRCLYCLY